MIEKKIKYLYKRIIQKIFILIYGKISVLKKNKSKLTINKINSGISNPQSNLKYQIYEIENARIFTDNHENVAIIKNNMIVPKISFQQIKGSLKNIKFNSVINKGTNSFVKKISGCVFNLAQGGSGNNYFHFMFDIIPKIFILKSKKDLSEIDFYYVSSPKKWQIKIFNMIGIKYKQLLNSEIYNHIKANKIISVDHPWYYSGEIQNNVKNIPKWIINLHRGNFLKESSYIKSNKKIFLDRSGSEYNHCQIENLDEIKILLKKNNFQILKPEKISLKKQIHIFKNASIIIGAHGASFTNIIFCKTATKIIEIIPIDHPNRKCETISKFLKLRYSRIKTKQNNFDKNYPFKIFLEEKHLKQIQKIIDL
tara:strand:- start:98 stop:1198 length:1101 start_codon:yes stop_codon:yes gene_type:complete